MLRLHTINIYDYTFASRLLQSSELHYLRNWGVMRQKVIGTPLKFLSNFVSSKLIIHPNSATFERCFAFAFATTFALRWRISAKGRKRQCPDRMLTYLESKLNPRKTSFQSQQNLASVGVSVDSTTVRRWLLAVGQKARRPIKKQFMREKVAGTPPNFWSNFISSKLIIHPNSATFFKKSLP